MMKILHVVYSFVNGGIETMLVNIANMQAKDHEVSIMIVNDIVDDNLVKKLDAKIRIIKIKRNIKNKYDLRLFLVGIYVIRIDPDVLHLHDLSLMHLLHYKRIHQKWIITKHNTKNVTINRFVARRIDALVAISESVEEVLFESGIKKNKIFLCYNGVNFSLIKEKEKYSDKLFNIVSIGRIDFSVKGQDVIIIAMNQLVKNGFMCRLELWGDGIDRNNADILVKKYELEKYVCVRGDVSHEYVEHHLRDFDLLVQASYSEGFGLSAIEALGAGVPCILSRVGGHVDISKKINSVSLFKPGNFEDLTALILLYSTNWNQIKASVEKDSKIVRDSFSIEKMNINLNRIYSSVLDS